MGGTDLLIAIFYQPAIHPLAQMTARLEIAGDQVARQIAQLQYWSGDLP
jgi:hypothetical protein